MTFVRASRIAGEHGYTSRLLMPGDQFESTTVENTFALFSSREEGGPTHRFLYSELVLMSDETIVSTLQPPVCSPEKEAPKKRRRSTKAVEP